MHTRRALDVIHELQSQTFVHLAQFRSIWFNFFNLYLWFKDDDCGDLCRAFNGSTHNEMKSLLPAVS